MKLDVLVTTFKRPDMLARALRSLRDAVVPRDLLVHVTVIDNSPSEETRRLVESMAAAFGGRLSYLPERRRGKSHALNAGIRITAGDLIGVIDDDEEVDPQWFVEIARAFEDPAVDFVGGPCLPRWGTIPPWWMPPNYRGVIGCVDDGDQVMIFGKDAPGILMGGNAVLRRRVIREVGPYSTELGPKPKHRLMSGEDQDLYARLIEAGAHGLYIPHLKIYHYVPPERLTKRYYRRWCFWNGVSRGVMERTRPSRVARIGRVPRYLLGTAMRELLDVVRWFRVDPARRFSAELAMWQLAGFVYGSYLHRKEAE